MKKNWAIRKDAEAVSPVIATILMVAITVVLAAVLYVMVLGFGGGENTPSVQITSRTTTDNGYKWTLTAPTSEVSWTDFTVILQSPTDAETFDTLTKTALTGTGVQTQSISATFDGSTFYLNVTDLGGNGIMSNGDYITIEGAFASGTTYTITMQHEPTDGTMVSQQWTV
ncbi:MAG: type IV pilin N-terminal domain-containing protein [Methanobacteriota archaeon]|nr:MAG: type IV pilin N-terminal domain-containing protein [Euryarchaeota archaeon]